MLSLSHVTAAQAENYYEKDDYYTQDAAAEDSQINRSGTQWYGHGAKILGLEGAVNPQTFKDLLHGQSPEGDCLHGRPIDSTKHRAATDYTFSAPKSVSIAGLIQQDDRVIAAHEQAVATALSVLESRYAQARITTPEGRQRRRTHNITAAIFRHETSREQDPQLHSHCVVINTTQAEDGSWRSLSNEEIIANQKLLGEIYQNDLAYQLRQVGYAIHPQPADQGLHRKMGAAFGFCEWCAVASDPEETSHTQYPAGQTGIAEGYALSYLGRGDSVPVDRTPSPPGNYG
jgi:conjugative relaxase-like TrwC/TraI family protein